jgi:hypothetical protein
VLRPSTRDTVAANSVRGKLRGYTRRKCTRNQYATCDACALTTHAHPSTHGLFSHVVSSGSTQVTQRDGGRQLACSERRRAVAAQQRLQLHKNKSRTHALALLLDCHLSVSENVGVATQR